MYQYNTTSDIVNIGQIMELLNLNLQCICFDGGPGNGKTTLVNLFKEHLISLSKKDKLKITLNGTDFERITIVTLPDSNTIDPIRNEIENYTGNSYLTSAVFFFREEACSLTSDTVKHLKSFTEINSRPNFFFIFTSNNIQGVYSKFGGAKGHGPAMLSRMNMVYFHNPKISAIKDMIDGYKFPAQTILGEHCASEDINAKFIEIIANEGNQLTKYHYRAIDHNVQRLNSGLGITEQSLQSIEFEKDIESLTKDIVAQKPFNYKYHELTYKFMHLKDVELFFSSWLYQMMYVKDPKTVDTLTTDFVNIKRMFDSIAGTAYDTFYRKNALCLVLVSYYNKKK